MNKAIGFCRFLMRSQCEFPSFGLPGDLEILHCSQIVRELHFAHVEAHPVGLLTFSPVFAFISASGDEVWNRTFLRGFGLCWICLILLKAGSKDYLGRV